MKSKKIFFFIVTLLCLSAFLTITNTVSLDTNYYLETKDLRRSQSEIFDNLFANYTFDVSTSGTYNTTFKWDRVSGDIYNVTWDISGLGISTWLEDRQTRLISSPSGSWAFMNGAHAPIWIWTNLTIGSFIWIAVDGEPSRQFQIMSEYNITLPDFPGTYETWVVQDLIYPGTYAYYEKATGLLMAGGFEFLSGTEDYTLVLIGTNMFEHQADSDDGVIPGYDLFFLIPIIAIFSLVILIRKRKKL